MTGSSMMAARPQRRLAVVAEDQKSRAKGPQLRQGQTVENGSHRVLADSEVQVSSSERVAADIACALEGETSLGRRRQIRGTADQPGMMLGDGIEDLA